MLDTQPTHLNAHCTHELLVRWPWTLPRESLPKGRRLSSPCPCPLSPGSRSSRREASRVTNTHTHHRNTAHVLIHHTSTKQSVKDAHYCVRLLIAIAVPSPRSLSARSRAKCLRER